MKKRLALIGYAVAILIPQLAFAEYPHYLNVMPAPPAATQPGMSPQGGAAAMAPGAGPQAAASMRMAAPQPMSQAPAERVAPREQMAGPVSASPTPAANPGIVIANPARPVTAPVRVAMPTPNAPPAPPAPSAPSLKENSGAWVLQCWAAPSKRCEILQQRVDAKSQQQILLIGFSINTDAAPQLTMVTPTGLKARATLPLMAGKETLIEAPLKGCIASGCVHILDVSTDLVVRLSGAKEAGALVQLPDDRLATISLDLNGLAGGMAKAVKYVR
jgi:invasion protein IalB